MASDLLRFAYAVAGIAIIVPVACSAIQINLITIRNGHGLSLLAGLAEGVAALPLALLAAPLNAAGAVLVGVFSLGLEKLIRRRNILIWMIHGLIFGWLNLLLFHPFVRTELITIGVTGSWMIGGVAMKFLVSAPSLADG